MFDYANRIKNIRVQYGVTAYKLAKDLEVVQQTISKIETGKGLPSLQLLEKFCDYFDITLAEFFEDTKKETSKSSNLNVSTEELVDMYIKKYPDRSGLIEEHFKCIKDTENTFRRMIIDLLES